MDGKLPTQKNKSLKDTLGELELRVSVAERREELLESRVFRDDVFNLFRVASDESSELLYCLNKLHKSFEETPAEELFSLAVSALTSLPRVTLLEDSFILLAFFIMEHCSFSTSLSLKQLYASALIWSYHNEVAKKIASPFLSRASAARLLSLFNVGEPLWKTLLPLLRVAQINGVSKLSEVNQKMKPVFRPGIVSKALFFHKLAQEATEILRPLTKKQEAK